MEIFKLKSIEEYNRVWHKDRPYLTGSQLKYIAIITMLLSHLAQSKFLYGLGEEYWVLADLFVFAGRLAMPIFCFFTVQAIVYTKDIKKYFFRLFIFAIISEVPFDLCMYGQININNQNVVFTLILGALSIFSIQKLFKINQHMWVKIIATILITMIFMLIAYLLRTDYSYKGVLAIVLLYLARNDRFLTYLAFIVGFLFEFEVWGYAIPVTYGLVYLAIPLIMLYNGKKGKQNKWAFYIFYPAHLFIIYLLKQLFL